MICPVCKCEPYELYLDINGDICGCDACVNSISAAEYEMEREEAEYDYHREMFMCDK